MPKSITQTSQSNPQQPLTEQQSELNALFTSIGEGAITTDEFGKITRINPRALKMLGLKESEVLGKWFPRQIEAVTVDGKSIKLIDRPISRAFLTGESVSAKSLYRRGDGNILPVFLTVSPILHNGRPLGAIEVFRDISEEEEIDRMKSEFISLASHQLRTPLSAVKTYSHMLIDGYMGSLDQAQKKALRTIIGASDRMNELISTLLNITRMESGTIKITPKYVSLDRLAQEVLDEISLLAADKEISTSLKIGKGSMGVRTDSLLFKEILVNLATNAIKYSPRKGILTLKLRSRKNDVILSVCDTGYGIPKSAQTEIFSKFYRASNVTRRETTGTGLGLYLVKGLTEALGGKIWFDSQEGKGTTFYVSLPAIKQSTKAKTQPK